jgi:hypothetical protein
MYIKISILLFKKLWLYKKYESIYMRKILPLNNY